jgi:hypothetical protein
MRTSFEFQTFIHDLERSLKLYGHSKSSAAKKRLLMKLPENYSIVVNIVCQGVMPDSESPKLFMFIFSWLKQPQGANNLRLLLFCLFLDVAESIFVA